MICKFFRSLLKKTLAENDGEIVQGCNMKTEPTLSTTQGKGDLEFLRIVLNFHKFSAHNYRAPCQPPCCFFKPPTHTVQFRKHSCEFEVINSLDAGTGVK